MGVLGWLSTKRGGRKQMSCSCKPLDPLSIPGTSTRFFHLRVEHVNQEIFEDTTCSLQTGHTWPRSRLSTNTTIQLHPDLPGFHSGYFWCQKLPLTFPSAFSLQSFAVLNALSITIAQWPQRVCPRLPVTVTSHPHRPEDGEVIVNINQQTD